MNQEVQREEVGRGVEIRRRGADQVAVVIPLAMGAEEDRSASTVLSRAWALLAEAIAENKLKTPLGEGGAASTPTASEDASHVPPGSGAWWVG